MRQLSYYTDNGAYYYYHAQNGTCSDRTSPACCEDKCSGGHTPPALPYNGTGYQKTLDNLKASFAAESLPVGAVQYDSWCVIVIVMSHSGVR